MQVCMGSSLKSGLAEVNTVRLHSGHGGGLGDRKDEATQGERREMIPDPSGAQEVFRHRFMGYGLSGTTFSVRTYRRTSRFSILSN
jgi:hypothetical protein